MDNPKPLHRAPPLKPMFGLSLLIALPLFCLLIPSGLRGQIFYRQESGTSSHLRSVDFLDDSLGLASGDNGIILRTTNGGMAWDAVPSGVTVRLSCIRWLSPTTALAAGWYGTVLRTTDAGVTWFPSSSGVTVPLTGCDAYDSLHAVVVGYGGRILVSSDGGVSWINRTQPNGTNHTGVAYADSQVIVVTGSYGRIARSVDGGVTWPWQSFGAFTLSGVDFGDGYNGIVVGDGGVALRTTDGGGTWYQFPGGVYDDIEFAAGSVVVAAGIGIGASTDGGYVWRGRTPPARLRSAAVFGAGDYLVVGDNGVILRTVMHVVQLPAPLPGWPADGSADAPLSPDLRKEFSLPLIWRDYTPYLAEGIHVQVSIDSTFGQVTFFDNMTDASSVVDTQRTIPFLVPGRTYYWRVRMAIERAQDALHPPWKYYSPWSDAWSFTPSVALHSRTIMEIQGVSADSLILADSLTELARDRWTLQASPLFWGTFFVTALVAVSPRDLFDPLYWVQGATAPDFFYGADTSAPGPSWSGMKFTPSFVYTASDFPRIRKGDVVVCSGWISEDPSGDMNSETSLYVSKCFTLDSLRPLPAPAPASVGEFFFPAGNNQKVRYSGGEPLEGSIVEFTNLTVHSVDVLENGTFNVISRDGLKMSTADFSRWFTLRAHRDPASTYAPPFPGRHIDTLRGAIVTTSGSGNSWSYPRYRVAPVEPGDIVYGAPTGNLIGGSVFYDTNRNGAREAGEAGVPGWKIFVAGLVGETLPTSPDGSFSAAGFDSGRYTVSLDVPEGWFVTTKGPVVQALELGIGDTLELPPYGIYYGWNSISGSVFADADEDGARDPGESGMPGIAAVLSGDTAETTATDAGGLFAFDRVRRGLFNVRILLPPAWEQIYPFENLGRDLNFTQYDQHIVAQDFSLRPSPPRVRVGITVRDRGQVARRDIFFGARAGASRGIWGADSSATNIDYSEGEYEIPPQIFGLFDARFVDPRGGGGSFGEGTWTDVRGFTVPAQIDTYRIDFQPGYLFGGAYPMRFFWPGGSVDSAYTGAVAIADPYGNVLADMKIVDSLVITDTTLGELIIIAEGPAPRITGVSGATGAPPGEFALFQNYPNPFNPSTQITYALPVRAQVTLRMFDILGREIALLAEGVQGPGTFTVRWDAGGAPGGVYFCRIAAGGMVRTVKMLLVK